MDGYILFIFMLSKYFIQIHGKLCISWSVNSDQLRIACKADKIVFSVTIYNPSGYDVAHCLLPFPTPKCFSNELNDITQDIQSGETVYVVRRDLNDTLLNGLWSCVHGSQNENASVKVVMPKTKGYNVPPKIILTGPKYVITKQKVSLLCNSNAESTDSAVYFQVNNQLYTKIYKNSSGCFIGLEASICQSDVCQCLSDGRSFTLQYFAKSESEVLIFRCSMNFKHVGSLSDCLFVSVVDLRGPFISSDMTFPLSAGSDVEISCKTIFRDYPLDIYMNCFETVGKTNKSDKFNEYIVKLSKKVTSSDNGTLCLCTASSVVTKSSSIMLHVVRAPILDAIDMIFCNNSDSVILSCRVSGEVSEFGFSPWVHIFHGTFIQTLTGNITGHVSFLSIDSCDFEDNGEYICGAWNKDSQQIFRKKRSTTVTVTGPPFVVDKTITIGASVTLSAKFISMQRPSNSKWYYKDRLLLNSTQVFQTMLMDVLVIRMHGKIITYNGYTTNLTVIEKGYGIFMVLLLLENDFGTTNVKFEFKNGFGVFNIRVFSWISLAALIILVSVCVTTIIICRQRRNLQKQTTSRAIYFAAHGQTNNVNIYNEISPYEEINDDYLVAEFSNSNGTSVKDETEDNQDEDSVHYLELQ